MSNNVQGSWKTDGPIGYNEMGGIMTQIMNKTGAASVKGSLLRSSGALRVALTAINGENTDCICYEDGVADGSPIWVVISGPAQVLFGDAVTAGQMARASMTADAALGAAGSAIADDYPVATPFWDNTTAMKIGGCMQTTSGAGLAWVMLKL
jgi:hypothetical protein